MTRAATPARPFGAVLTAMVTPMTPDGAVDLGAAVELAKTLVAQGNDGLVLNGTTGEAPTTHAPEKAELVRAVVDAVGDDAFVLAGAGSNDTAHAVRMAEQAAEAGAHGLLVITPYYSRPSQPGVVAHCTAIADATDLPVMLYDVPGRTGVRFAQASLDALAAHDRVVAIKDATGDAYAATTAAARTGLAWYSGDDGALLTLLAAGGVGIVSVTGHVAGTQLAAVVRAWDACDHAEALRVFRTIVPAIDALNGAGFQAVAAKAACELLDLIPTRSTRLPLVPATDDELDAIRDGLRAAGLLDVALR
ncbi:4-hydroxy-tetrahydrodipicolinate synthase [Cellulomonas fimi]|uniref:4-hydroxy-tetrahydrodipicolinate synthase n=1 Tax=Cellulomonas fimi (strain ATCC 484 / DSM 20113 / JCM 1341 / CCUG 24087 / LMG 16345 / NBRC 15513 / NCIMB 8980 / NCTC 7547 / NRS-133) TaxID=590998 RepID=F4H751_CELFA|nr:4-hydroxy-tetrahydrodipicolinate synthase [Cellulomonas fimi]AEE45685.1 dihydrodipicolinate synthase [Cellulomonas fimi ATCC 484]NNH07398.1 4-hydroxy-tetrahydrodipicolinate synthase [Cellulomonas fimi]VEH30285.1 Dihydrodipicolinate synthase [Cellulomonas fimi]